MLSAEKAQDRPEGLPGHYLSGRELSAGPCRAMGLQVVVKISVDSGILTILTEKQNKIKTLDCYVHHLLRND